MSHVRYTLALFTFYPLKNMCGRKCITWRCSRDIIIFPPYSHHLPTIFLSVRCTLALFTFYALKNMCGGEGITLQCSRDNYFSSIFTSSPHNVSLSPPRLFLPLPLLSIFIKKIQKSRKFGLGVWKVFKTKKFTCLMYRDR